MNTDIETLRKKYMENPPEGMTSQDIRSMSEDALLDMDYFLNDDELDDDSDYIQGQGVDIVGGVEAIISHFSTK